MCGTEPVMAGGFTVCELCAPHQDHRPRNPDGIRLRAPEDYYEEDT